MKKGQFLFIISLLFSVFSCNKDSEEASVQYPLVYESSSILESEIRVYTQNGELTSMNLKEDVVDRYKNSLTDIESIDLEEKIVATYLAADTVRLTLDNSGEENNRLVKEYAGIIYWEKQDTSIMPVNMAFDVSSFLKHQPLYYEEFDIPTPTGFTKTAKYKECYFAIKKDKGFAIPMFDFVYKTESGQPTFTGINNEFSEDLLPLIGENDTIIIQSYTIELK